MRAVASYHGNIETSLLSGCVGDVSDVVDVDASMVCLRDHSTVTAA